VDCQASRATIALAPVVPEGRGHLWHCRSYVAGAASRSRLFRSQPHFPFAITSAVSSIHTSLNRQHLKPESSVDPTSRSQVMHQATRSLESDTSLSIQSSSGNAPSVIEYNRPTPAQNTCLRSCHTEKRPRQNIPKRRQVVSIFNA